MNFEEKILDKFKTLPEKNIPKILYHYTPPEGLLGIIKSKKIWASNIQYLNDKDEFKRTIRAQRKYVLDRFKKLPEIKKRDDFLELLHHTNILNEVEIYVISFTEESEKINGYSVAGRNVGYNSKENNRKNNFVFFICRATIFSIPQRAKAIIFY